MNPNQKVKEEDCIDQKQCCSFRDSFMKKISVESNFESDILVRYKLIKDFCINYFMDTDDYLKTHILYQSKYS